MVSECQFSRTREGAIAQLGERLNGIQEVVGSIPISSTNKNKGLRFLTVSPCFVPAPFEKMAACRARAGHGVNGPPLPPASTFAPAGRLGNGCRKKRPLASRCALRPRPWHQRNVLPGRRSACPVLPKSSRTSEQITAWAGSRPHAPAGIWQRKKDLQSLVRKSLECLGSGERN